MFTVDNLQSKPYFRSMHPAEKLLFAAVQVAVCTGFGSWQVCSLSAAVSVLLLMLASPNKMLAARMLIAPAAFLLPAGALLVFILIAGISVRSHRSPLAVCSIAFRTGICIKQRADIRSCSDTRPPDRIPAPPRRPAVSAGRIIRDGVPVHQLAAHCTHPDTDGAAGTRAVGTDVWAYPRCRSHRRRAAAQSDLVPAVGQLFGTGTRIFGEDTRRRMRFAGFDL